MPKPTLGFCGLGAMGLGMATNLVSRGYTVKGFDVSPAAVSNFQKAGGIPVKTLSVSANSSPFYIVMVANSIQAQQALFDEKDSIASALPEGAVLCMCCTVSASYIKSVAAELSKRNRGDIRLVDCPVSGGANRAARGKLTIMCGGEPEVLELASPLLEDLTDPGGLFVVEGGLGQGSNMKMCHQVLASVQILAVGEMFGLGFALGLDAEELKGRILESDAWSWIFENRSPRTIKQDYVPAASALSIITKDTAIITSTARKSAFPTPMTAQAEQVYVFGCTHNMDKDDDAGIVRMYIPQAVGSVRCTLDSVERDRRIRIVIETLIAIHVASASEAIMLADHCGIPLPQFFDLVQRSAGNSRMFGKFAQAMRDDEGAEPLTGRTMEQCTEWLAKAIDEAMVLRTAMPLANMVLNLFEFERRRVGEELEASNILRTWD